MPYDSQGVFTRVMNWQEDAANSVPIVASRHDDEDDNFAQGFNEALCRDGRAAMTGNLKMGLNKITGVASGTTTNDAVNKWQLDSAQTTLNSAITTLSNAAVKLTGNQSIAGTKTFTSSPIIPTPSAGDNSTKAATTAFVKGSFAKYGTPNYASQTSTSGTTYTTPAIGWVSIKVGLGNNESCAMKINDKEVWYQYISGDRSAGGTFSSGLYKVGSGAVITTTHSSTIYFYPES